MSAKERTRAKSKPLFLAELGEQLTDAAFESDGSSSAPGTQSAQVNVMQQPDLHCHPSLDRALLDRPEIVVG